VPSEAEASHSTNAFLLALYTFIPAYPSPSDKSMAIPPSMGAPPPGTLPEEPCPGGGGGGEVAKAVPDTKMVRNKAMIRVEMRCFMVILLLCLT